MASKISKEKRAKVYNKYNGRCAYCGCKLTKNNKTVDHWVPISGGGDNNIDNLYPCCLQCNKDKGNESLVLLRLKLAWNTLTITDFSSFHNLMKKVRKQKFYYEMMNGAK